MKIRTIALSGIVLAALTGCVMPPANAPSGVEGPPVTETSPIAEVVTESPEPLVESPAPTEEPEPEYTLSEQNAIRSAESYISFMAFSRQGLIDQLMYEEYTVEEATLAVDTIEVDWNEQASLSAESYLDSMAFSRGELANQLEYEGFTPEQIEFGLTAVGY